MNGLDLFSGIGGIGLALSPWVRTVAYCERERYVQGVLLSRMQSGDIDTAPIWDDVQTLRAEQLPRIDIISGGFPCQDISVAGAGRGLDGERSGLFFEICRLIGELRPRFVFLENVPAISVRGLDRVLLELTALGYDTRWTTISAESVGACHLRKRWFLLAHSNKERLQGFFKPDTITRESIDEKGFPICGFDFVKPFQVSSIPENIRMDDGLPHRVDRIKCLGNSVVPKQVQEAFIKLITGGSNESLSSRLHAAQVNQE